MGLVLDSTVLITAERQGQNARALIKDLLQSIGDTEIALSVITLIELSHGAARADTLQRRDNRERFIDELLAVVPVHPVSVSIALRAGKIDGERQAQGIRIALADLLIGVTALELGYEVATGNPRHFAQIPGVTVRQLR